MKLRTVCMLAGAALIATTAFAAALLDIDSITGVYKHRFKNGDVAGETYESEDILEVVKVSPNAAYVRAHLEFFNGHLCAISGIAVREGDALVYRPKDELAAEDHCALALKIKGDRLVFEDKDAACRDYCGERGAFGGAGFQLSSRRSIRYMPRLLASQQYSDAMKEYKAGHQDAR